MSAASGQAFLALLRQFGEEQYVKEEEQKCQRSSAGTRL